MTIYFILTIFTTWENKNVPIFPTVYYCIDRGFLVRVEELFLIYHNSKCTNPFKLQSQEQGKKKYLQQLMGCVDVTGLSLVFGMYTFIYLLS